MRLFRLFFFSPSAPDAAGLEVFFAALVPSVVFAGALEAVEAGAFPAVDAGLGAICERDRVVKLVGGGAKVGSWWCEGESGRLSRSETRDSYSRAV